jgi:predicted dehydrogenase
MDRIKVGIIGCGNISGIYFKNCQDTFRILEIAGCADLIPERSAAKAEEYGVRAYTVPEMLADPEIQIIINLTIPIAHTEVCLAALNAGKSVYVEKPLAITREDGRKIIDTAKAKGLLVGCAPDTFLGGGIQTCRKLIDQGA